MPFIIPGLAPKNDQKADLKSAFFDRFWPFSAF